MSLKLFAHGWRGGGEDNGMWTDSPEKFYGVRDDHNRSLGIQALVSGSKSTTPIKMYLEDYRILGLVSDS